MSAGSATTPKGIPVSQWEFIGSWCGEWAATSEVRNAGRTYCDYARVKTGNRGIIAPTKKSKVKKADEAAQAAPEPTLPLLGFLVKTYPHSTLEEWRAHCCAGRVRVNGTLLTEATMESTVVTEAAKVEYLRAPWDEPAAPVFAAILFRDSDFVVVYKPSGLPVLPSEMYYHSTLWRMLHEGTGVEVGGQCAQDGVPTPAHRLGVGTSGLVLCGCTPAARRSLCVAFEKKTIHKTYRALVSGVVAKDEFTVDCPIGPVSHEGNHGGAVHAACPDGGPGTKAALSHMKVVARNADSTLLEVVIPTGRAHQIRIHTAFSGHPLVGDPLYLPGGLPMGKSPDAAADAGRCPLPRDCGYLLHAYKVVVDHPITKEPLCFVAPPPVDALCLAEEVSVPKLLKLYSAASA